MPPTVYRFFLLDGKLKLGGFVSTILAANLSLGNFDFYCQLGAIRLAGQA